ncbi:hypothetical protein Lal_00041471 [Lupinus albus]|nr:hypothetical protein Lal_00041471 [Lupinus albus]
METNLPLNVVKLEDRVLRKIVWDSWTPLKIRLLAWRIILDRLPSKWNLVKRSGRDFKPSLIPLSFLLPNLAASLWVAGDYEAKSHYLQHVIPIKGCLPKGAVGSVIWMAEIWYLWRYRNDFIFNNKRILWLEY